MKVVIQRVDSSSVVVNNDEISSINNGLLILWGVEVNDSIEETSELFTLTDDESTLCITTFIIIILRCLHGTRQKNNSYGFRSKLCNIYYFV